MGKKSWRPESSFFHLFLVMILCAISTINNQLVLIVIRVRWMAVDGEKVNARRFTCKPLDKGNKNYNHFNWKINCLREIIQCAPDAARIWGHKWCQRILSDINSFNYISARILFVWALFSNLKTPVCMRNVFGCQPVPLCTCKLHNNHSNL